MKDFCCYIAQPLDSLPKAFGFQDQQIHKGFFPHRFVDCLESLDYVGQIPAKKYFGTERFKQTKHIAEFDAWYAEKLAEGGEYNLRQEAKKYCMQDTVILAIAVQHFRRMVLKITNGWCDPIVGRTTTLPGLVSHIYRSLHMPESGIGLMPRGGYGSDRRQQSILAMKYLEFLNEQRRHDSLPLIQHAGNSPTGELKVGGYKVDGVTRDKSKAYEIWYVQHLHYVYPFSVPTLQVGCNII